MSFQKIDRNLTLEGWVWIPSTTNPSSTVPKRRKFDLLAPLRKQLDQLQVQNAHFAHLVCKTVPPQCPFERDVKFLGKTLFHIPPMCKLNPLYEEVVSLRFRALCYLADDCGEDISRYC
jgi:hypothetical protein